MILSYDVQNNLDVHSKSGMCQITLGYSENTQCYNDATDISPCVPFSLKGQLHFTKLRNYCLTNKSRMMQQNSAIITRLHRWSHSTV
jgi:hypothetical protein